jgi:hypothetical protein
VSYKPSADEPPALPDLAEFRRRHEAVDRFVRKNDLVGMSVGDARNLVEAAGYRFRCVDLDDQGTHVLSADMASDRVTATVRNGHLLKAEPH